MPITDVQARKAAPRDKDYKIADSGGLYLLVTTRGFKSWRLKYRFASKEKRIVLGPYPQVTLAGARAQRDRAKELLRAGRDPAIEARKLKLSNATAAVTTFAVVGDKWHELQSPRWSEVHRLKVRQRLDRDLYPALGPIPLAEIDGPMVLAVLRKVEARGAIDTAKRLRQDVSAIFGFGIAEGYCATDPAGRHLLSVLKPTPVAGQQPALVSVPELRRLLADLDGSSSSPLVKAVSWLIALTAVRPGVARGAQWDEFEGVDWGSPGVPSAQALWRIPATKMKLNRADKSDFGFEHLVPLDQRAVDLLHKLRPLSGRYPYVFHSVRSPNRPMTDTAISMMYIRQGYARRHVPHGWRSSFSTIMNERAISQGTPEDRAIIDAMLAHKPKGMSARRG